MEDESLSLLESLEGEAAWGGEYYRLMGEIYEKRHQMDLALECFRRILSLELPFDLPYGCRNCRTFFPEWSGRCPSCHQWNTIFRTDGQVLPGSGAPPVVDPATALSHRTAYQEYFSGPGLT